SGSSSIALAMGSGHVNGIVVTLLTPLVAGARAVLKHRFSPATFWPRLVAEQVRIVSVVPLE
ncbi:hypothetical protein, partial [Klebsiella aerogenes]|uniref:hypothetical protein n=1 Tax=Klebsiella aerogenes TaxID=548 RepID=UPI001954E274